MIREAKQLCVSIAVACTFIPASAITLTYSQTFDITPRNQNWTGGSLTEITPIQIPQESRALILINNVSYSFTTFTQMDVTTPVEGAYDFRERFTFTVPTLFGNQTYQTSLVDPRYFVPPWHADAGSTKTISLQTRPETISISGANSSNDFYGTSTYPVTGTLQIAFPVQTSPNIAVSNASIGGALTRTLTYTTTAAGGPPGAVLKPLINDLLLWGKGLGNPKPPGEAAPALGITGDATDILRRAIVNQPAPKIGATGVWLQTASPASIYHAVTFVNAPKELTFDYEFLDAGASFSALLGPLTIFRTQGAADTVGLRQHFSTTLSLQSATTELEFLLEGAAGHGIVLENLSMDGLTFDTDGWASRDHGVATFVLSLSEADVATINAEIASVPEPHLGMLLFAGLGVLSPWLRRRGQVASA